jgi:hypothetical protein
MILISLDINKKENNISISKVLTNNFLTVLGINKYLTQIIPLHLQLCEINLEKKFKKQKFNLKQKVPILPYFQETLKRFALNIKEKSIE